MTTIASGLVQVTVNIDGLRMNDIYRNYLEVEIYNWKLGSYQACKGILQCPIGARYFNAFGKVIPRVITCSQLHASPECFSYRDARRLYGCCD